VSTAAVLKAGAVWADRSREEASVGGVWTLLNVPLDAKLLISAIDAVLLWCWNPPPRGNDSAAAGLRNKHTKVGTDG